MSHTHEYGGKPVLPQLSADLVETLDARRVGKEQNAFATIERLLEQLKAEQASCIKEFDVSDGMPWSALIDLETRLQMEKRKLLLFFYSAFGEALTESILIKYGYDLNDF